MKPSVITSRAAEMHFHKIVNHHNEIVRGIEEQARKVASYKQQKAQEEAQRIAQEKMDKEKETARLQKERELKLKQLALMSD